ncbi:uncharacterized protein MYCFIDRAFT_82856 [Pseudocercospora fijiensis CIRAD86]|uniref:Uncharacterized protein n=1 Tax=Pseudocercospora fijiensis (strain CIRAD86) TaxID=383855 RepID=M2Z4Q1_PSEFD|nr:uncharacterized protein MYCFIDRAFT_82856 [Pseudocercospora fijiensis CIRAD86]EME84765.1 hypothetical protein MYCFIDRAFT_82856 [Pseudocercospora fijiensis CIRAD86]
MSNNAAARVFGVAELLEAILDFLPPPPFGSPRLRKRMIELEPDRVRSWLFEVNQAIWIERTLSTIQKENSKLMRVFRGEFVVRRYSDLASLDGIKAMAKKSTQGSWRRVKLVQDSAISPVVVLNPMVTNSDFWAFAEPGTTLGELLDGEWVDDAKKLLPKTSKDGVHLAVEDWTD